jgi:transcriptional regulator with XRE-family HTH domain
MTLAEYLSKRGRAIELSRSSGLAPSSISRLAKGLQKPSYEAIQRIAAATAGEVGPADWFSEAAA